MQSRLAATAPKLNRFLIGVSGNQFQPCRLATIPTGKAADPAIHAVNPEEKDDASEAAKAAATSDEHSENSDSTRDHPYMTPKSPYPSASSPKIQSTGVKQQPTEPITQQKRHASANPSSDTVLDVSCAGLDGSPWPDDSRERREERKDQEKDDKVYYEHHKPSPLSEIEIADSRKPITKATDGTADSEFSDYGGGGVLLWRPEQLDTAEDSLRRAMEIWKENAIRGDPDSPHGRVLRALRGEYW